MGNEQREKRITASTDINENTQAFSIALSKIATASAASSRAAIEAAQATKPSLHTRFVHDPQRTALRLRGGSPPYLSTRYR